MTGFTRAEGKTVNEKQVNDEAARMWKSLQDRGDRESLLKKVLIATVAVFGLLLVVIGVWIVVGK